MRRLPATRSVGAVSKNKEISLSRRINRDTYLGLCFFSRNRVVCAKLLAPAKPSFVFSALIAGRVARASDGN